MVKLKNTAKSGVPSATHVWLVMTKAMQAIGRQIDADLMRFDLNGTEFRILEALLHKGPLPVNIIGPKVNLTAGAISVAVNRLLERGFVRRDENPRDRRIRTVSLTKAGEKVIGPVFRSHQELMERVMGPLTQEQRSVLERALKTVGRHAETLTT